jgi:hypothetical protein
MKRLLTVLTVLVVLLVTGAIPEPSEASSPDIVILEDNFDSYLMVPPSFPNGWERLYAAKTEPANNRVTDTTSFSPQNSFQIDGSDTLNWAAIALYKLDITPTTIFLEAVVQPSGDIKKNDKHQSDIWVGFVTRNGNLTSKYIALFFNKDGYIYGTGIAEALKEYTDNEWYSVKIGLEYIGVDVVRANYWINGTHMNEVILSGPFRDYLEIGSGAGGKGWIDDLKVWSKENGKPVANAGGPYTFDEGETATLDASGSYDPDANIVLYEWDLDNDSEYDDSTGVTTTAVFHDDGIYTIGLKVTDGYGELGTDIATITVNDLGPTAVLTGDTVLNARQAGDYDAGGSSSSPDVIVIYEWDWNYDSITFNPSGDTGITQSHTWNDDGNYTVVVRVTDDDGSTDIASLSVTVENPSPEVMIEYLNNEIDDMELPEGLENSLKAPLKNALKVLEDSNPKNDVGAINALKAFINKIEAQRGKKITDEVADDLIANAQKIIAELSGGT